MFFATETASENSIPQKYNRGKSLWIFYAAVFVFLVFLCYLFPYSGDDWAWGSQIGIERLSSFFADYNGRYAGNVLILAISRFRLLRSVTEAVFCVSIISAVSYLSNMEKRFTAMLSAFLFFTCGRLLFRQSIVWASGFSNYVPPILFVLIYLCICKSICLPNSSKKSELRLSQNVILCALITIMSFIGSLFIEHMTIYSVIMAISILIAEKIKCHKIYAFSVCYLAGSVVGAICMFINGAYGNVADGSDGYRTMANGISGCIQRAMNNAGPIFLETVQYNLILNTVTTVLLVVLVCKYLQKEKSKIKAVSVRFLAAYNTAFVLYSYFAALYPTWKALLGYTTRLEILLCFVYMASTFILLLFCLENGQHKFKALFCYISIGVFSAPLFFVTPIGSRCFFPGYVFQMIIACLLAEKVTLSANKSNSKNYFVRHILGIGVLVACLFWTSIFGYVFKTELRRNRYVKEQLLTGQNTIEVIALPYSEFMWNANPSAGQIWTDRYKMFYGIDKSKQVKEITLEDYLSR